jgi:hypothetical protein
VFQPKTWKNPAKWTATNAHLLVENERERAIPKTWPWRRVRGSWKQTSPKLTMAIHIAIGANKVDLKYGKNTFSE